MNHRTGKLTRADFEPSSQWHSPPSFFTGPIEHTSDFGQVDPGKHFSKPAMPRMWDVESESWYPWALLVVIFGTLGLSHLLARCSP